MSASWEVRVRSAQPTSAAIRDATNVDDGTPDLRRPNKARPVSERNN